MIIIAHHIITLKIVIRDHITRSRIDHRSDLLIDIILRAGGAKFARLL